MAGMAAGQRLELLSCGIKCTIDLLRDFDAKIFEREGRVFQEWTPHGTTYFILFHWYIDSVINEICSLIRRNETSLGKRAGPLFAESTCLLKWTMNEKKLEKFVSLFPADSFDSNDLERINLICRIRDILYHNRAHFYRSMRVPKPVDEIIGKSTYAMLTGDWMKNLNLRGVSDENFEAVDRFTKKAFELTDMHDLIGQHQNKFTDFSMAAFYMDVLSDHEKSSKMMDIAGFPTVSVRS